MVELRTYVLQQLRSYGFLSAIEVQFLLDKFNKVPGYVLRAVLNGLEDEGLICVNGNLTYSLADTSTLAPPFTD